jgi:hypothetical protein
MGFPSRTDFRPPDTCSYTRPHAAHTWGGRPMRLCPGVGRQDLHLDWEEEDTRKVLDVMAREGMVSPEPTTCIDCGQPTTPGKGSARCPSCWQDRCQSYEETPAELPVCYVCHGSDKYCGLCNGKSRHE